jgi:hypothetical protein
MERIGDLGRMAEAEMVQRMWPGGVQPETGAPYVVSRSAIELKRDSVLTLDAPGEVVIYVPTQGASVGYTTDAGANARWRLYTGPIRVDGPVTLRTKAVRYGYRESAETRTRVVVAPQRRTQGGE